MALQIVKASGRSEQFDIQKLTRSLVRSGATDDIAREIAKRVEQEIPSPSSTKSIYILARRFLRQYNRASGMKYSIKSAIYSLGPSGYQFEKYVARLLTEYGYSAEVGRIMEGYCVQHEVDVLASKGNEHFIIECKYHLSGGTPTDVKVALYVHSRFDDIRKACELRHHHAGAVHRGWLVTNTRCTTDAIKYAECVGLNIMSWRYPESSSLEKMIEAKRLYPVTILPAARKKTPETLFKNNIILAQDIADMSEQDFIRKSGLDRETALIVKKQADELCPCTT